MQHTVTVSGVDVLGAVIHTKAMEQCVVNGPLVVSYMYKIHLCYPSLHATHQRVNGHGLCCKIPAKPCVPFFLSFFDRVFHFFKACERILWLLQYQSELGPASAGHITGTPMRRAHTQ